MNDDNEIIWQKALEIAKSQVQESEFIMWFRLDYLGFENGTIRLRATNTFLRDQFVRKYSQFMKEIISSLLGMPVELSVESESVSKPIASVSATLPKRETPKNKNSMPPPPTAEDFTIEEPAYTNSPTRAPHESYSSNLQPRYTFESFVVGENNNFAFNAATAVSEKPGVSYNPLLIYGGVGLGKTHLMHAIGNRILELHPNLRIICITAENFTNEFIKTIHDRTTNDFKNRYRNVDVLLIDDIHFFKASTAFRKNYSIPSMRSTIRTSSLYSPAIDRLQS